MTINPISFSDFLNELLTRKKKIVLVCFVAAVIGVIVAFSIPKVYLSKTSLVAEEQNDPSKLGGMASMASLAGIKLGNATDAIIPDLYPDVLASNKFLVDLINVEVKTNKKGERMPYIQYVEERTRMPWWSYPGYYFFRWLGNVLNDDGAQKIAAPGAINPERLNRKEDKFVKELREDCTCTVDEETGVITINFRAQDPLVAKIMVDTVTANLQRFITLYRTNKARVDTDYYQGLVKEAQLTYEKARERYADYCDTHTSINLQSFIQERDHLENELQLAFNQYSAYKTQVLTAEAKVQERTPAFTVIEQANVPLKAESPRKVFLLAAFIFIGFLGYAGWIYCAMIFSLGTFKKKKLLQEDSL